MGRCGLGCVFAVAASAGLWLAGIAHAQAPDELRPGVIDDLDEEIEASPPVLAPPLSSLTVNPILEPPPRVRKIAEERDPYAPTGIDLGGFNLFPVLRIGAIYTDNVGQDNSDRKGDIGLRLRPAFTLESDWVRHSLNVYGSGDFAFYKNESDNDAMAAYAAAVLKLEVRRSTDLLLEANYTLSQDSAGESDVPDDAVGYRTDQTYEAVAALVHRWGRFESRLRTGIAWQTYGNVKLAGGGEENNSDRSYYEPEVALRTGYGVSPAFRPYVEVAYLPRRYETVPDDNGVNRNSNGYAVSAGVAFEPSPIWSGDLALTYLIRDYEDPSLKTIDAVGLTGFAIWRPTPITAVTFSAGTSIDETSDQGSSGARDYEANIDVRHDVRENVTLTSGAGIEYEHFQGIDLDELTVTARLGAIWRLSPWFALTGDYDFTYFDSSEKASDYYENRFTAGIELRR